MKLTRVERLILANQFEILGLLKPEDAKHYQRRQDAVACGYALEYEWIADHVYEKEFSETDCRFVVDVLSMYDALQLAETSSRTAFPGFDGNNESSHMAYARHFMNDAPPRFEGLKFAYDGLNAHMPTLDRYSRMLVAWNLSGDKHHLSPGDIDRITGEPKT